MFDCVSVEVVLVLCVECGLLCVCYVGKINFGFVELVGWVVIVVDV